MARVHTKYLLCYWIIYIINNYTTDETKNDRPIIQKTGSGVSKFEPLFSRKLYDSVENRVQFLMKKIKEKTINHIVWYLKQYLYCSKHDVYADTRDPGF